MTFGRGFGEGMLGRMMERVNEKKKKQLQTPPASFEQSPRFIREKTDVQKIYS